MPLILILTQEKPTPLLSSYATIIKEIQYKSKLCFWLFTCTSYRVYILCVHTDVSIGCTPNGRPLNSHHATKRSKAYKPFCLYGRLLLGRKAQSLVIVLMTATPKYTHLCAFAQNIYASQSTLNVPHLNLIVSVRQLLHHISSDPH